MAVDRSSGATVLLAVFGAVASGLVTVLTAKKDPYLFLGVESGVILVLMVLELVRRKSIRERCAKCGSDIETHFLATTLPPRQSHANSEMIRRLEESENGPTCRVCTDLESDRASRYPTFTKFDKRK